MIFAAIFWGIFLMFCMIAGPLLVIMFAVLLLKLVFSSPEKKSEW